MIGIVERLGVHKGLDRVLVISEAGVRRTHRMVSAAGRSKMDRHSHRRVSEVRIGIQQALAAGV